MNMYNNIKLPMLEYQKCFNFNESASHYLICDSNSTSKKLNSVFCRLQELDAIWSIFPSSVGYRGTLNRLSGKTFR